MKNLIIILMSVFYSSLTFAQQNKKGECKIELAVFGNEIGYLEKDPPLKILIKNDPEKYTINCVTPNGNIVKNSTIWANEFGNYIITIYAKNGSCKKTDTLVVYPATNQNNITDIILKRTADKSKKEDLTNYYRLVSTSSIFITKRQIEIKKNNYISEVVTIFDNKGNVVFKKIGVDKSEIFQFPAPLKDGTYTIFIDSGFLRKIDI